MSQPNSSKTIQLFEDRVNCRIVCLFLENVPLCIIETNQLRWILSYGEDKKPLGSIHILQVAAQQQCELNTHSQACLMSLLQSSLKRDFQQKVHRAYSEEETRHSLIEQVQRNSGHFSEPIWQAVPSHLGYDTQCSLGLYAYSQGLQSQTSFIIVAIVQL